ncbi:protein kinase, partial [Reticulomyxa filosa]
TKKKLEEEALENDESDDDDDNPTVINPDEKKIKPEKPCSLAVVDSFSKKVTACDRVNAMMGHKEHVNALAISPDGMRLAIGTNYGRLIVCNVQMLTDPKFDNDKIEVDSNRFWIAKEEDSTALEEFLNVSDDRNTYEGSITSIAWSPDGDWITTGYGNGDIKLWKKNKERRMTVHLNRVFFLFFFFNVYSSLVVIVITINCVMLEHWMKRSHVNRRPFHLFTCRWQLEARHSEPINGLYVCGPNPLLQTWLEDDTQDEQQEDAAQSNGVHLQYAHDHDNNSPITLARVEQPHKRRMVTSIALTYNYQDELMMVPTSGLFLVSSGADHRVVCTAVTGIFILSCLAFQKISRKFDLSFAFFFFTNSFASKMLSESHCVKSCNENSRRKKDDRFMLIQKKKSFVMVDICCKLLFSLFFTPYITAKIFVKTTPT